MPVFMPGADTEDTTQHIVDALAANPSWAVLTKASHPASTSRRTWFASDPRCAGETGDGLSCDEYPFFTTLQGGPGASLRLVPGREQSRQGGYMKNFYAQCNISEGDDFVVAPVPTQPTTTWTCAQ